MSAQDGGIVLELIWKMPVSESESKVDILAENTV